MTEPLFLIIVIFLVAIVGFISPAYEKIGGLLMSFFDIDDKE